MHESQYNKNISVPYGPYYYNSNKWYSGSYPTFERDPSEVTLLLEQHYATIRREILAYYERFGMEIKPNFTPHDYQEKGWRTVNLISYLLKYNKNCVYFPNTMKVLEEIPNLSGAQISVLQPGTRLKAHFGDTDAIIRNHLGIHIPDDYPIIGFRIGTDEVCWKEGKTISFCIVHRHFAWNYSLQHRIIFQVDVFRPEFAKRKNEIAAMVLALMGMKLVATKFPFTKRTPHIIVKLTQRSVHWVFRLLLFIQEQTGINVSELFANLRSSKISKG